MEIYCIWALFVIALLAFVAWGLNLNKVCLTPRLFCKRCSNQPYCTRWHKTQRPTE